MVRSGHGVSVRELDDRLYATAMSQKMNSVPGYRTSAAFFTFLRANLALPPSVDVSTASTPLLEAFPSHTLPPLGPSSLATMTCIDSFDSYSSSSSSYSSNESVQSDPSSATSLFSDDVWPRADDEAIVEVLWMDRDKDAALQLIKTSILEQKFDTFKAVVSHPLVVTWWTVLCAVVWKICLHVNYNIVTTASVCGVLSTGLIAGVWKECRKYNGFAEHIDTGWIRPDDIIIGARNRDEVMSAAVLRLEHFPARNKRRKTNGKGLVMAWTTKRSERRKGFGKQVLEEAVRIGRERAGNGVEIGFAAEHANSHFPLPVMFNKIFRKNERRAASALDGVVIGKGHEARGIGRRRFPRR